jgi:hypothetical protein
VPYYEQVHYPLDEDQDKLPDQPFLVYLDVWERHVTHIKAPGIREVALGGPDTATRSQVVWQVKVISQESALSPEKINEWWPDVLGGLRAKNRGELIARTDTPVGESLVHPCITDPEAHYRGAENQLYRVEIHRGGRAWDGEGNADSSATFKWSRDNGSVVTACVSQQGNDLIVSGVRDGERGFAAGQWVEFIHDELELRGKPGTLVKLIKVEGETLSIDPQDAARLEWSAGYNNPRVRRWDHQEPRALDAQGKAIEEAQLSKGAILVSEGISIQLEQGVWVEFQQPDEGVENEYCTGDYWLIPARTATGDVEWPRGDDDEPLALPPHGIEHHYAPLAVIKADASVDDCRYVIKPITELATPPADPNP